LEQAPRIDRFYVVAEIRPFFAPHIGSCAESWIAKNESAGMSLPNAKSGGMKSGR
jgi:hypothetical protein